MSKTFGALFGRDKQVTQPTGFGTLPQFAQEAWQKAVQAGQNLSPEAFTSAPLTEQQTQALQTLGQDYTPLTADKFNQSLAMFQNPYTENVLQGAIADVNKSARGFASDIGAGATDAGAFGGTRQATLEAQLGANTGKTIGDLSNQIRSQAYQSAADKALNQIQTDYANQFGQAGNLFNIGSFLQEQNTANKQAPQTANSYLASLAQGIPTGGGGISYQNQQGILNRIGTVAQQYGNAAGGFAKMGM